MLNDKLWLPGIFGIEAALDSGDSASARENTSVHEVPGIAASWSQCLEPRKKATLSSVIPDSFPERTASPREQ